jgi:predicted nucleotidyltransferase
MPARAILLGMSFDEILPEVLAGLERLFGLECLILFGSEAAGASRADSDLDLAALFRTQPTEIALLEARSDLERLIGRAVDLVDLDEASPILLAQILRKGRCVFGERSSRLAALQAMLPSRYEDLRRVRAAAEAAIVERVLHGRS